MRCGRCGNENDATNRFCGMCGTALVATNQAARPAGGQVAGSGPEARSEAWPSSRPVISGGPSLLGLNLPASDAGRGREDGGRDALRPSSNVDYLLEDEEEPRRSRGKIILIVAAMALAAGFGYLRWKGVEGFDWMTGGDRKPAVVAVQTPEAGQSGGDAGAGAAAPQAGGVTAPAGNPGESGAPPQTASQETASQETASQQTSSQSTPAASTTSPGTAAPSTAAQSGEQQSAAQSDAGESGAAAPAASSDSSPAAAMPRAVAHKPAAARPIPTKPTAAKPVDSVTEAERYIYGRGVRQDCDRGLRLLKPAAQSNAKAMISMGVLYSTGTCTPRDLPTAYRWFALALHKEPDNQALQDDLQSLWSKMTQPERQLAIKLSR